MAGLSGQDRSPRAPVRERRNFDNLSAVLEFIGPGEVIAVSGDGVLTLTLATNSGLANLSGALSVLLDPTNPGLVLSANGIAALVQGVLSVDASGVLVNIGSGLENNAGNLAVALAANPGLEFSSGDLRVQLDGSSLTLGASGLSVTNLNAQLSVPATVTTTATATLNAINRYDATGGTFTITLPTAAGVAGQSIEFKEAVADTTGVTIDGAGAETIDGAATLSIGTVAREHTRIISDGANWLIA